VSDRGLRGEPFEGERHCADKTGWIKILFQGTGGSRVMLCSIKVEPNPRRIGD
jgi:hypothetical protein